MNDAEDEALAQFVKLVKFAKRVEEIRRDIPKHPNVTAGYVRTVLGAALARYVDDTSYLQSLADEVEESRDE